MQKAVQFRHVIHNAGAGRDCRQLACPRPVAVSNQSLLIISQSLSVATWPLETETKNLSALPSNMCTFDAEIKSYKDGKTI